MNRMKKLLALLLVLALGLSLAACGSAKSDIIGTWQGRIDMTEVISGDNYNEYDDLFKELISSAGYELELNGLSNYMSRFDPLFICVFNEDSSYSITVDEASLRAELEEFKAGLVDYFRYFYAELFSKTLVDLGVVEQVSGVEELEAIMGVSLDEALNECVGMEFSLYLSQTMDKNMGSPQKIMEELNSEGKYKAKDGKLWLSAGLEYNVDPESYDYYSIAGNILTIEEGSPSEGEVSAMVYPLVFEKTA